MKKDKPGVYVNRINRIIKNSQDIYYSKNDKVEKEEEVKKEVEKTSSSNKKVSYSKLDKFKEKNVEDKLEVLMTLPDYLFNINLEIITKDNKHELV